MADLVTSRIFVDGEKGITAAKLNDIVASSVIQPAFYTSKPTAGTADPTDIALILKSGAYAQVPISTLGGSATQAQIWSTRLRSFNAIGNPNFEVDQRTVGNGPISATSFGLDRWFWGNVSSSGWTTKQIDASPGGILLPGTNFCISSKFYRFTLTTAASAAAADRVVFYQVIEGTSLRELIADVSSIQVLVRSSVANASIGLYLQDTGGTRSLTKLITIPTANTWTLVAFPNIPVFSAGGGWSINSGVAGYNLGLTLLCGSTKTSPANDTWQNGSFNGAAGQSNFASNPVNSTFDIAFVQHEPGSVCSTLMDKPFTQNLFEVQRYYQKSYDLATAIGAITANGEVGFINAGGSTTQSIGALRFNQRMAKVPTVTICNAVTGAANSMRQLGGTNIAVTSISDTGESGFTSINATGLTANSWCWFHYTADTGW